MAVNLASAFAKQIADKYTMSSFTMGNASTEFSWEGNKTISILTPTTVPLNNYSRTGADRFGTPTEMQDIVQELTLRKDRSFSITIDRGNNEDQNNVKGAARMLKMQIEERVVPEIDKYVLGEWAYNAGTKAVVATPTSGNIVGFILAGAAALDNALVPSNNRILYIKASEYNLLRQSTEFLAVDNLAEKALSKGMVGMIADMKVIKVPDSYLKYSHFLITHKRAVLAPHKIKMARILNQAPGIDGNLLEGRDYYDAFVLGARCGGVYTAAPTANIVAAPALTNTSNTITITAVTGVTFHYTVDGTDPRYSPTAADYSSGVVLTSGQKFRAYGTHASKLPGAIAEEEYA